MIIIYKNVRFCDEREQEHCISNYFFKHDRFLCMVAKYFIWTKINVIQTKFVALFIHNCSNFVFWIILLLLMWHNQYRAKFWTSQQHLKFSQARVVWDKRSFHSPGNRCFDKQFKFSSNKKNFLKKWASNRHVRLSQIVLSEFFQIFAVKQSQGNFPHIFLKI
jgi:hypothetical protein